PPGFSFGGCDREQQQRRRSGIASVDDEPADNWLPKRARAWLMHPVSSRFRNRVTFDSRRPKPGVCCSRFAATSPLPFSETLCLTKPREGGRKRIWQRVWHLASGQRIIDQCTPIRTGPNSYAVEAERESIRRWDINATEWRSDRTSTALLTIAHGG